MHCTMLKVTIILQNKQYKNTVIFLSQQSVNLFSSGSGIFPAIPSSAWLYDINICHGIKKNVDAADGGCPNSTVI